VTPPLPRDVLPDPTREIRLLSLRALRGANLWASFPVVRLDVAVGAYNDISSAEAPGVPERLRGAMPGLALHRCSIGERGGFLTRLRRGTYAPHVIEHVGLELQSMAGHDVGFGRARGGDRPGEYTVVFEHRHTEVGLRAAALALEVVQRAFQGTLESVDYAVAELQAIAQSSDPAPVTQNVLCGVTGGGPRAETRDLLQLGTSEDALVVDVAPAYILNVGLPYARSEGGVVLDAEPTDVPERYREPERAQALVSVLADAVRAGGFVVVPACEWEVQDRVRDAGLRVAVFSVHDDVSARDARVADLVAFVRGGRILFDGVEGAEEGGTLKGNAPVTAQVAAAAALRCLGARSVPREV
jgi:cyanophycin synthetase